LFDRLDPDPRGLADQFADHSVESGTMGVDPALTAGKRPLIATALSPLTDVGPGMPRASATVPSIQIILLVERRGGLRPGDHARVLVGGAGGTPPGHVHGGNVRLPVLIGGVRGDQGIEPVEILVGRLTGLEA
jgi:hypothetical protein